MRKSLLQNVYSPIIATAASIDQRIVWQQIEKVIPETMAQLNATMANGDGSEETASVDVGAWVKFRGQLMRKEEVPSDALSGDEAFPPTLSVSQSLREILLSARGKKIDMR